ncbi:hypothetical protein OKA05_09430 [Luteolibacter arcticus]|uniref:Uncharacterized protein n=1 Tax=Luteolibacter arcticus TaxID=1581411 RepID=A0ABT3GGN0_9BACT|nr:hypothetical protein [Luteolibacter arcticus]MCW1922771.1 hypothetical protein [Luteolibacter arcticus]
MNRARFAAILLACGSLTACPAPADKPVGPVSDKTTRPWNPPVPGQGAGALGVMPQQPRR